MSKVTCRTYGSNQVFPSRKKAIAFFKEAISGSEGSEQSRYVSVLLQLMDGNVFCSDELDY